jgi:aminopeptidase N
MIILLSACQAPAPTPTPTQRPPATQRPAPTQRFTVVAPTRAAQPTTALQPTAPHATATLSPTANGAALPAPAVIEVAWDDRSVFRSGLIESEQGVLDELPGASVYHLDVRISANMRRLEGQEEVRYTNQESAPLNEVYIRLFPNRLGGRATIANLQVNGEGVQPSSELENSAVRVPFNPPLAPGAQAVIQMDFSVDVPTDTEANYGSFVYKDRVLALAHFYPLIAVFDDEGWNVEDPPEYGDIIYADSSFYLVRVSAPAGQTLVASGVEIERSVSGEDQVVTFAAGPMRDFYLVASDQFQTFSQTAGQTTIHSYGILGDGAIRTMQHAADALRIYGERVGVYPFSEMDLVSTPNLALGIEYPGIMAITTRIYGRSARLGNTPAPVLLESTVAHEVAHQWFYSVVGNDQVDEPWLDEALAQYLTLLYYRDLYGDEGAVGFEQSFDGRWQRVDGEEIPIGMPVKRYSGMEYGAIVYGRGPLFFEALAEEQLAGNRFTTFLHDYYAAYQWGIADGEGLKRVAEQVCACDLTPMFEEWVYAP